MDKTENRSIAAPALRRALFGNYMLLIYTALALAGVLTVINLVIFDHNVRFDLTPTKRFTLSDFDRHVLAGVTNDVKVMCFIRTEDPVYLELEDILFRVATFNPRVSYQIIDVNRAPGLARQYGVSSYGEVVVESQGRRRDFDNARPEGLIPAILQVTHNQNKVLYFSAGHGERDLFDSDRSLGYSQLRYLLLQDNYQIKDLALLGGAEVPDDASIVLIVGPRKDFSPDELQGLRKYLTNSGKLIVMLDPYNAPTLVVFLKQYGIEFLDQVLVDPAYRLTAGEIVTTQIPLRAEDNSISRSLLAPAVFSMARGIAVAGQEGSAATDGLRIQRNSIFLRSSHESWASGDSKAVTTGITEFKNGRDIKGPIAEGVEVDLSQASNQHKAIAQMTRIVALADSDFCSNQFIEMLGNRDLVLNAVNEVAGDQTLIASRERVNQSAGAAFYVSDQQAKRAFMLGTVAEPAALFMIGLAVFIRRRFFI
jgi:ABC-type uncharacterized transport system involved in gliding motility auxiliary subunit